MASESGEVREFTCASCGETFETTTRTEEAEAEAEALFGVKNASTAEGMAQVCDECFGAVLALLME